MLRLELVDDTERLYALKPEWSGLARSPFQSPEWALAWWRHFGSGALHTLVFRDQGRIAAIIPAFLHPWNGHRQLTLIGSGITDYLDPPLERSCEQSVIELLAAHLESNANWDVCEWQDLSPETPLQRIKSRPLNVAVKSDIECSAVPLPETEEKFWQARTKGLRRNVRRYRQKAEEQGKLAIEAVYEARPELIEGILNLHEARWKARGEPGMVAANRSAPFLRDIAQEFADRGILRLFTLWFDNELAAGILAWLDQDTLIFYMSGFQPRYEWFSPGHILLGGCLSYSYANNYRRWDFLRGTEAYKLAWGATPCARCRLLITRS